MIEVLKQALDAFHQIFESTPVYHNDGTCIINDKSVELSNKAIASLRQAIAELESQEPVAWLLTGNAPLFDGEIIVYMSKPKWIPEWWRAEPLYTHPSQRTWQGLTDEEKHKIWYEMQNIMGWYSFQEIANAIEAKLKERNI